MSFKDLSIMIWHQLSNSFTFATVQRFIWIKILTKAMCIIFQGSYTVSPVKWLISTNVTCLNPLHLIWNDFSGNAIDLSFFFDIPQESGLNIRHNPDVCYSYITILW